MSEEWQIAKMSAISEVVERPGLFWLTDNDYWNAHAFIWREEGGKPYVTIRAKDWPALVACAEEFGMTVTLTADEVASGHGKLPYPDEDEGLEYWKETRPIEFHWKLTTEVDQTEVVAPSWPELRDFLEEMGMEPPEEAPLTLRQQEGLAHARR